MKTKEFRSYAEYEKFAEEREDTPDQLMKVIIYRGWKQSEKEIIKARQLLGIIEPGDICKIGRYTVECVGNQIYFKR